MNTNDNEFIWTEKYRPGTVADCILPSRLKVPFQKYVDTKQVPNMILTGSPGVGKTTVAIAMCEEIGLSYMKINASKERGIDTLRTKITNYASTISLKGGAKVIILDEADSLTPEAQLALRGVIEEYTQNCTFILTCNYKSKLMDALHSRSAVIDFTLKTGEKPSIASQFFARVMYILDQEKVVYDKAALAKIIERYFPDYRRTLNELQRLATIGAIDAGAVAASSSLRNFKDLAAALKQGDFTAMRKWVADNGDIDTSKIYRQIYDSLGEYFEKQSIPQAVVIISRYQYQAAFVSDQEINLVACLTELMVDCTYI